jgi:hypothetical protein
LGAQLAVDFVQPVIKGRRPGNCRPCRREVRLSVGQIIAGVELQNKLDDLSRTDRLLAKRRSGALDRSRSWPPPNCACAFNSE